MSTLALPLVALRSHSVRTFVAEPSADDDEIERLVLAASSGDANAWHELWRRLSPRLTAVLRKPHVLGALHKREDPVQDVVVAVMAKLRDEEFRRLRVYLEARRGDPELTFMRWVIVVAKRVAIDRVRADPDYVDQRRSAAAAETGSGGAFIETRELPDEALLAGTRLPITNRVTARQILRYAEGVLSGPQRRAVEMWAEQASSEDIARELGLEDGAEADRLVRAGVERLRRKFRKEI